MSFELSKEHEDFRRVVREFAQEHVAPHVDRWDAEHYFPVELVPRMGELGLFGLLAPEEYGGHGIGTEMHQDPHVLNYRTREQGRKIRPGLCLAIEPMLTAGRPDTKMLSDHWTVATVDGSRSAHWEHSVALPEGGLWVLTAPDGGEAGLASVGLSISPLGE